MNKNILTKYKKIQDLFYRSIFKETGFICQNCGKKLKTFHGNHFKKCGMSKDEYINKFGYPNKYYEKDAILKEVTNKIADLYIVNRNKWLILSGITRSYTTNETDKIKEQNKNRSKDERQIEKLTTSQIKAHLEGRNTLGVFPKWNTSKFLVFDIDSYGGLQNAKVVVWYIKWFLKRYFPKNQIHVNFSGNKGYHVTLYFDSFIDIKVLYRLFNIVLNGIQIENFRDVRVEMRPTIKGPEGCGIKLPLGVNFINRDDYNNYAFFADDYFREVECEIEYVLNIEKSSSGIVWEIIDSYKDKDLKEYGENFLNIDADKENDEEVIYQNKNTSMGKEGYSKIKYIIENGLEEQGTRHYWSFLIALYYKELGLDKDEAFDHLFEWSKKQIETGMSRSSLVEAVKDINKIIYKSVYGSRRGYYLPNHDTYSKDIFLTKEDMNKFVQINDYGKYHGKMMIHHQKVLFALLVHGKQYRDTDGKFYMTYEQILLLSDLVSRDTVNKCITELDQLGFIEVVLRNNEYDKITGKRNPNVFKINFADDYDNNSIKVSPNELKDKDCFYRIIYRYFGEKNLHKVFKRSMKHRILKMNLDYYTN